MHITMKWYLFIFTIMLESINLMAQTHTMHQLPISDGMQLQLAAWHCQHQQYWSMAHITGQAKQ